MNDVITVGEVAKRIGVPKWRIIYAHQSGKLPEPMRLLGQRAYDGADVDRVRQFFVEAARTQLEAMEQACVSPVRSAMQHIRNEELRSKNAPSSDDHVRQMLG